MIVELFFPDPTKYKFIWGTYTPSHLNRLILTLKNNNMHVMRPSSMQTNILGRESYVGSLPSQSIGAIGEDMFVQIMANVLTLVKEYGGCSVGISLISVDRDC